MDSKEKQKTDEIPRPPVVVVMGHIDHGKTTLLDFIRSSNVAAGEAGSITQHIGAYEVEHNGTHITFLDTPGHESFSRMRARGALVADVAVLVVAADDGVKPQTLEALRAAKDAHIPFVVAISKIDTSEADSNRVKGELAGEGVLLEGWGGTVPVAEISARTGQGIPELLDLVLLVSEMEELTASREHQGGGIVIESHLDRQRGAVATIIIKDGVLRQGDWMQCGGEVGSIRIMENSRGESVKEASFSSPVRVLGFAFPPAVGDTCSVYAAKQEAEEAALGYIKKEKVPAGENEIPAPPAQELTEGVAMVPLVIKTDVAGSREALEWEVARLSDSLLDIRILRSGVGDISDDDVKLVSGTEQAIIIGFKVKVSSSSASLAERYGVTIYTADIIYELLDWLRAELEKRMPPEISRAEEGALRVLKVFKKNGASAVFGGSVTRGVIRNGAKFEIMRGNDRMGTGTITNTQRNKVDVKEVSGGFECGLAATVEGQLEEKDTIITFTETVTQKKLGR